MGSINKRIAVQACPGIKVRLYLKNTKAKRTGGMAQVVEHLHSKDLSSNPSTEKEKKEQ
jgi:hypothetical protein